MKRVTLIRIMILTGVISWSGCDMGKLTVDTTSKVLYRAQPALQQESDYDLAAQAFPATLKTIEGFWYVDQKNPRLLALLAEGYCQYGTGFVEDVWEQRVLEKRLDEADYQAARATKMFVRCTNYALRLLGKKWREGIYADFATVRRLLDSTGQGKRDALMWAGIGLASTIDRNKANIAMVSQLPTATMMLERVVALDDRHGKRDPIKRAFAHVALGMIYTAQSTELGGDPKRGADHFLRAQELTDNKFLLPKVLYARRYAVMVQDRELFRKTLIEVLQTAPSIWPEQRLINELAHRRARRYLHYEKEWF